MRYSALKGRGKRDAATRPIHIFRRFALTTAITFFPSFVFGDVEVTLGKSPDKHFEVILTATSNEESGRVIVRDLKKGGSTETGSGQGYGIFPSGDVKASWKNTSDAFAVTMRGTKRTWNIDVYIREGDVWERLEFPPYVANILGRPGVFKSGRRFTESFGGFQGKDRFTLFSHVEPDWQQQEQTAKQTDWKPSTRTDWKIVFEYYHRSRPNCSVISIEPFTEENGGQGAVESSASKSGSKPAPPSNVSNSSIDH